VTDKKRFYTTQLGAGLGLIAETRALLELWQPTMDSSALYQVALHSGRLPNVSARRLRNIVMECFAPRYLIHKGLPAVHLKKLEHAFTSQELGQLLFLYTCRANLILADFVRQVYWDHYRAGHEVIRNKDANPFVAQAVRDGKTQKLWSDNMIDKVASYLTGCCGDYGLLEKGPKSERKILPFRVETRVAAYLAYDLHVAGLGDNSVIGHDDWALFGLERNDVRDEFKRLSLQGYVIVQSAGEIARISWHYTNLEGLTDVIVQS
jgi:BrxA